MKTWEVKLLAGNNGIVQMNVSADEFTIETEGVTFLRHADDGVLEQAAFYPMATLLSIRELLP